MNVFAAMCIGVVLGMGAGFTALACLAPRLFELVIKKGFWS
jgi:hypothetical protein